MIDSCTVHNVDGTHTCDINTDPIPLHTFDCTPMQRTNTQRDKTQQHGRWSTLSFRGGMEIHVEGDILANDSSDYFTKRQGLVLALFGTPGALDLTNRKLGYLQIHFTGSTEDWKVDYTISAFTAALDGASPAYTSFAITFETWDAWWTGVTSGNKYFYS